MKILLDESLPRKLKDDFGAAHEIWTVRDKGWLGKKNVDLLKLMIENHFQCFVTVDRNLPHQQNLDHMQITKFILCAANSRRETLQKLIPKLLERLTIGNLKNIIEIS